MGCNFLPVVLIILPKVVFAAQAPDFLIFKFFDIKQLKPQVPVYQLKKPPAVQASQGPAPVPIGNAEILIRNQFLYMM